MTAQTLTALYDTRSAAETARDDLVALGIPSNDIAIHGAEGGSTATADTTEDKGFWGSLMDMLFPEEDRQTYTEGIRRGGYLLSVRVSEDMQGRAVEVLERSNPVDIDERAESWRQSGWTGYEAGGTTTGVAAAAAGQAGSVVGTTAGATSTAGTEGYAAQSSTSGAESLRTGATEGEGSIPVIEEEVRVGKREAGGGRVRVRSYVTERPVEEQVNLREERVNVERRPVDRPLEPGEAAFQEKEIEAVERAEEAVVEKQARVKEEVALSKDVDTRTETVRDTVRKTEVEVENEDDRTGRGSTGTEEITTSRERSDR